MPGAVFLVDGKRKVMTASRGLHNSIKNDAMIRRKKKMICENCKNGIKSENLESIERTEACKTCNNQIIPKTEIENVLCPACSYIYHRCEKCGKDLGYKTILTSLSVETWNQIKSGKKTLEIRKSSPKGEEKFAVLCYLSRPIGMIVGAFFCDRVESATNLDQFDRSKHLMTKKQLSKYSGKVKKYYGWHISNVIEFQNPFFLHDINEKREPTGWKYVTVEIDDDFLTMPSASFLQPEKFEDNFYHPLKRKIRSDTRKALLELLPLPYRDKKLDDDDRAFGWNVLPTALIPLLLEDMTLSDNTIRLMCEADKKHADIDMGVWKTDPYDNQNNTSLVLIACCIKDDIHQTLGQLALCVSYLRKLPFLEVARHLAELNKENKLGYFKDTSQHDHCFVRWYPATEYQGASSIKGLSDDIQAILFDSQSLCQ